MSERTFRVFGFSPSLSALSLFPILFKVLVQWCHFPILLCFFFPLAYLERDKLTHSLYCDHLCVPTSTQVLSCCWPSVCAFAWKVYKSFVNSVTAPVSQMYFFAFLITLLSLCDVQWLVTPCRCAWPTPSLVVLLSANCPFHVDQFWLKVKGWERSNKMF